MRLSSLYSRVFALLSIPQYLDGSDPAAWNKPERSCDAADIHTGFPQVRMCPACWQDLSQQPKGWDAALRRRDAPLARTFGTDAAAGISPLFEKGSQCLHATSLSMPLLGVLCCSGQAGSTVVTALLRSCSMHWQSVQRAIFSRESEMNSSGCNAPANPPPKRVQWASAVHLSRGRVPFTAIHAGRQTYSSHLFVIREAYHDWHLECLKWHRRTFHHRFSCNKSVNG